MNNLRLSLRTHCLDDYPFLTLNAIQVWHLSDELSPLTYMRLYANVDINT